MLDIDERCTGRLWNGFRANEALAIEHVSGVTLERQKNVFALPAPSGEAHVHYRIDLDRVAKQADDFDVAMRSGKTLIATVSTWLLQPLPASGGVPFELRVRVPPGYGFTTGLAGENGAYRLEAHEIPVATYSLFGPFRTRRVLLPAHTGTAFRARQSEIEIAILDGPLAISKTELERWIIDCSTAVADFWHGFPVPHALIAVIPAPDRHHVVFGKVLPASSPGVALVVGEKVSRQKLYEDWILVHELFHLGVPSFKNEGRWFDEGLATYFEPIIRARAGYKSEEDVWSEFVHQMPRGLGGVNRYGLEQARSWDDIYWGGAIVLLLADLEIRKKSDGTRGLEDGLRGVLDAGGTANHVWPLAKTLDLADRSTGGETLGEMARQHAERASPVDLRELFRSLGIEPTPNGVLLNDRAPLAKIRKRIVFGNQARAN